MTRSRLLAETSSRELSAWMAFYQVEAAKAEQAQRQAGG